MGQVNSKHRPLPSRKDEARSLLKNCFRNKLFSAVPFEIWRWIIFQADNASTDVISRSCWGFKELVDSLRFEHFDLALKCRREGNIREAQQNLRHSIESGNSQAMLHVGYAYMFGGWGLKRDHKAAVEWFKKSAHRGNAAAMAMYAHFLIRGNEVTFDCEKSEEWANKALASNNLFAVGYCHFNGVGTKLNYKKALAFFKGAAERFCDEFGEFWLGEIYITGYGVRMNYDNAFYWFSRSAEQGLADAQYRIGCMYEAGVGCTKNIEMANSWFTKAANQGHQYAISKLK